MTAVADAPDALAFDRAVGEVADDLAALGDTSLVQVRRAKALGILADPQYALDVHATAEATADPEEEDPRGLPVRSSGGSGAGAGGSGGSVFHLHVHTDTLTGEAGDGSGVVRSPRLGPLTWETVRRWLTEAAPGTRVTVTPVVDLTARISVDAYEVPERLRTQVEHRDTTCVFPHCGRAGWFDADHIEPYVPMDKGGTPGQTSTEYLARLCRFHHRVKTHPGRHGTWTYARQPDDGSYAWTSPMGRQYLVDHTGTRSLD